MDGWLDGWNTCTFEIHVSGNMLTRGLEWGMGQQRRPMLSCIFR